MNITTFWQRVLKIALYSFIAYVAIGYLVFILVLLHHEISLLPDSQPVTVSVSSDINATLSARVHNIFGDPVPYAVIVIDNQITQADSTGFFTIENLEPKRYALEIFAGEYQPYNWDILIDKGTNNPTIKYDTGLWPQFFLPDFHVFHNNSNQLFGLVGFANGAKEHLYIHRATIYDSEEKMILDLFTNPDILEYYQMLSNKVEITSTPQTALKLPPKTWISGEIPPIDSQLTEKFYYLEIHYGTEKDHLKGTYQVRQIIDSLDADSNLNPHLP